MVVVFGLLSGCNSDPDSGSSAAPTQPAAETSAPTAEASAPTAPTSTAPAKIEKVALLGIDMSVIPADYLAKHKINPMTGILVTAAKEGWPAQQAGIKAGDVIYRVGDTVIESFRIYRDALVDKESAVLKVYREGKHLDFTVSIRQEETADPPAIFDEGAEKKYRQNLFDECQFKGELIQLK
jgi:S1-C subfamily serine protease